MSEEKYAFNALKFREIKEKERMSFYTYAMESTRDYADSLGISFEFLQKFCKINRILLGLLGKILMRQMNDYIVEIDEEIAAGFSVFYLKKEDEYILANVFTRSKYQGKGLGNALMQKIIQLYGNTRIKLGVDKTNEVAIHLYKKYGFKVDSTEEEYLGTLPLETFDLPENYNVRLAVKEDLDNIQRLMKEIPNIEDIQKKYKKSFNKADEKKFRLQNQLPAVLEKNNEIVGIGKAAWTKGARDTAQIIADTFLPETVDVYPCFISFLTEQAVKYNLSKYIWIASKKNEIFREKMKIFVGNPLRTGFKMIREIQ